MKLPGEPDPEYVAARRALLDAFDALAEHLDSVVLVGAQAIYLHTGAGDLATAVFTTDGDLSLDPRTLADNPHLDQVLGDAGFSRHNDVGRWTSPDGVYIDLMVPLALAERPGRRSVDLSPHAPNSVRWAKGLEGASVERSQMTLTALDPNDQRARTVWVAGPAALLIAKVHKFSERLDEPDRMKDKDALDALRLLQAVSTHDLANGLRILLETPESSDVCLEALGLLRLHFADASGAAVDAAARAAGGAESGAVVRSALSALVNDVLSEIDAPT